MRTNLKKNLKQKSNKKYLLLSAALAAAALLGGCGDSTDYSKYVTLGKYKGLEVTYDVEAVSEKELQEQITESIAEFAEYKEADGKIKEGQLVELALQIEADGEVVYDYLEDGYEMVIGEADFGHELDEALIGHEKGDVSDLTIAFDESNEDIYLAGKEAECHVEIRKISDIVYPSLTDKFVKENFGVASVEEWKADVKQELQDMHETDATQAMREELVAQAVANATIDGYSRELYKQCKAGIEADYQSYADMFGCSVEEIYEMFEADEKSRKQEYLDETNRVMVMSMIREQEQITLDEEVYEQKLENYALENEYESVEELLASYDEDSMKQYFLNEAVIDFLEKEAMIVKKN